MKERRRKGERLRPCTGCGATVNFVPWAEERHRGNIWHWANEDGSHHSCAVDSSEAKHIREIAHDRG